MHEVAASDGETAGGSNKLLISNIVKVSTGYCTEYEVS